MTAEIYKPLTAHHRAAILRDKRVVGCTDVITSGIIRTLSLQFGVSPVAIRDMLLANGMRCAEVQAPQAPQRAGLRKQPQALVSASDAELIESCSSYSRVGDFVVCEHDEFQKERALILKLLRYAVMTQGFLHEP